MVASVTDNETKLSPMRARFARAIAQGATQANAYKLATGRPVAQSTAETIGNRWANLPEVKAKVRQLLDVADEEASLRLAETKRLLSEIARDPSNKPPTHGERIAAMKLHGEYAGTLRADTVALQVNVGQLLGQLGPPVVPPSAGTVIDIDPTPASSPTVPGEGGDPKSVAGLRAEGGNPQPAHLQTPFYNCSNLVPNLVHQVQEHGAGVNSPLDSGAPTGFVNELGEWESLP